MEIISVDSGRNGVKAISANKRLYFKALTGDWRPLRNDRRCGPRDFKVEYQGQSYFVGSIAREAYDGGGMMLGYKAHWVTKLLILTAVHQLVENNARIHLVTGQPLAFHNEHDKARMRGLFNGTELITVNGVHKQFSIARVDVAAEGASVAWFLGRHRTGRFHVVDIGSRTVNYATAVGGKWIDRESDSLDYGADTFRGSDDQLARVVISDLAQLLRPLGPIVLIGGKENFAPLLKRYHDQVERHPDALFINATAFRELGVLASGATKTGQR